jgi:3-hydroxybutyryl-CoA dehydratase
MVRFSYNQVRSMAELKKGQSIETTGRTIYENDVTLFMGLGGDTNPIHLDEVTASGEPYRRILVPATLVSMMALSLFASTNWLRAVLLPFLGMSEWRIEHPVFQRDTIRSKVTVEDIRLTSDGQRYIVKLYFEVLAHRGKIGVEETKKEEERVMYFTALFMAKDQELSLMP